MIGLLLLALALNPAAALAKHGGPPPHGGGKDGLTSTLDVTVTRGPENDPHIHVTVTQDGVGVVRAEVVLTITAVPLDDRDASRVFEREATTGKDGVAHFERKGKRSPRPGTYYFDATAAKDQASGSCGPSPCLVVQVN